VSTIRYVRATLAAVGAYSLTIVRKPSSLKIWKHRSGVAPRYRSASGSNVTGTSTWMRASSRL